MHSPKVLGDIGHVVSAGTIRISVGADIVTLDTDSMNRYGPSHLPAPLFIGGETLDVSTNGAAVPAFSRILTAPNVLTLTSPALPGGATPLQVSRSKDLEVAVSGGGAGTLDIQIEFASNDGSNDSEYLLCSFAAGGTAVVPSTALSIIPAGAARLNLFSCAESSFAIGPYEVSINVSNVVMSPGMLFQGCPTIGGTVAGYPLSVVP